MKKRDERVEQKKYEKRKQNPEYEFPPEDVKREYGEHKQFKLEQEKQRYESLVALIKQE